MDLEPIKYLDDKLYILDQRKLPFEITYLEIKNHNDLIDAIKNLSVRGAPLLGLAGLYGLFTASNESKNIEEFLQFSNLIRNARPTANNLSLMIDKALDKLLLNKYFENDLDKVSHFLLKEINMLEKKLKEESELIAKNGFKLIEDNDTILTHCNTGSLAVGWLGTALGIIKYAYNAGKKIEVYYTETRPLLQGARLTSIELLKANVPSTLIVDSAVGYFMKIGKISKVIVGADRIAKNGDTANKIGTYNIAVLAKYHKIPFYVAAPKSTFDTSLENGCNIPIEFRDSNEIKKLNEIKIAPEESKAQNPAFDVTPRELITAFITEAEIIYL
jgi:methylthioribose-1-phosphate isomerase